MKKLRLARDLRKLLLRGHPWVYHEALEPTEPTNSSQLCQVSDRKGKFLGWGIYDPQGTIALRLLSFDRQAPGETFIEERVKNSMARRRAVLEGPTNGCRLINGEGDELPGLVCDLYNEVAVLQCDGQSMSEFWLKYPLAQWITQSSNCQSVFYKARHDQDEKSRWLLNSVSAGEVEMNENGRRYLVDIEHGQKTGFFLDQRQNRDHVSSWSKDRTVLNLFSYSGGFSIAAGVGGAKHVTSVDISAGAIATADRNWRLNELSPEKHLGLAEDVHVFLENCNEKYDLIVVDPPSMAPSEKAKPMAIQKYVKVFALAAKKLSSEGHLFLSSCSSHISFDDFSSIVDEALSLARKRGSCLTVAGQGSDHPFPQACQELRYLKFFHLLVKD